MNILDRIIADKYKEVSLKKKLITSANLEKFPLFGRKTISLSAALKNSDSGIIAEHKRRSPSKAVINQDLNVEDVVRGYEKAGACGISILTDSKYFGGSLDDFLLARAAVEIPLLRKEFIVDEYQLLEAKAYGADVILLIAAVLDQKQLRSLAQFAQNLDLEVLLEVHDLEELERSVVHGVTMIGVNNRNLKTFEVSTDISKQLADKIPTGMVKISESGISSVVAIRELQDYGYRGFLVGENFMRTNDPGKSASEFINELKK